MKKIVFAFVIYFGLSTLANSQTTFSTYRGSWSPYLGYYSFKSEKEYINGIVPPDKRSPYMNNGFTLGIRGGVSLISLLFDDDSRFLIGDYMSTELGVSSIKSQSEDGTVKRSFGGTFGFDLGLSTGFAITEKLEIGVQVLFVHLYYTSDLDKQLAFQQGPIFIPSIKFGNALLMCGYGKGVIGGTGYSTKGKGFFIEPRYFNSGSSKYVFFRFERNWGIQDTHAIANVSIINQKATFISFGIGFSY